MPYLINLLIGLFCLLGMTQAQNTHELFSIGLPDGDFAEFHLAPSQYSQYDQDPFYVIGSSDPADWPYVLPGPNDQWAAGRMHQGTIVFGLKHTNDGIRSTNRSKLIIDFVDTQAGMPPKLEISINGTKYIEQLPFGAGDASIEGSADQGKAFKLELDFPDSLLVEGTNVLTITSINGSWCLFDAIRLQGGAHLEIKPLDGYLALTELVADKGLIEQDGQPFQRLNLHFLYSGPAKKVWLKTAWQAPQEVWLENGNNHIEVFIEQDFTDPVSVTLSLHDEKNTLWSQSILLQPIRKRSIYILPHSHTDIGYTEVQTAIEDKQVQNLVTGMADAARTWTNPEGSRYVWNVEVGWAADLYLQRMNAQQQAAFVEAVKLGQVSLNGLYLNELTGLCRPEELLRLFRFSQEMEALTGQSIDAAMISDVPGYTWGTVTAMAQAGIKYFSVAPNYFDRIGDILEVWENKPFYWVGPSGKDKVLVWIPYRGYAMSHIISELNDQTVQNYLSQLDESGFPYDIAYMRWAGHGDNAVPDPIICEYVKEWNATYTWPKFIISSTSEAFAAFEEKYGSELPEVSGDWTPYWEDGAGSSARETAMNRNSSDRLSQAQTLFALFDPAGYPVERFEEAWRNVLLYSEHTWGAWCSVTDPEHELTTSQWEIKKGYAEGAEKMSVELLEMGREGKRKKEKGKKEKGKKGKVGSISVVNTCSWERGGLVVIDEALIAQTRISKDKLGGLKDGDGKLIPMQLLADSSVVFYAEGVPAFGVKNYQIVRKDRSDVAPSWALASMLRNKEIMVHVDETTGNISYLGSMQKNLVDTGHEHGFNEYLFFEGSDVSQLQSQGAVQIKVKENGAVVKSIEISSAAPGAHSLKREIRLIADQNYVEIINTIDKKRAPMPQTLRNWTEAQNSNKESVNLAFPFLLPDGVMRLDIPLGEMIPWKDQLPSGCKNWFTIGRYVDISNQDQGVTWVSLDAPLIEVGEVSANLVGSQTDPSVWRKTVEPTQTFYSWVMNNHWGTNYRQHQEGVVSFRYVVRPHAAYDAAAASRFATGLSQPLLAMAGEVEFVGFPITTWPNDQVLALAVEPLATLDGYAITVYNPTDLKQDFDLCEPISLEPKELQVLILNQANR